MDVTTYFQLFWAPAIASAILLVLLWAQNGLAGRSQFILATWFLLALMAQYMGTLASATWVAGFVLQAILAVGLLLKVRADQL
jgi:hypothetical protein